MHAADLKHAIHAKGPILRGTKISPVESGHSSKGTANFDGVTYYVVRTATLSEKRFSERRRTRLRSGKIVNPRSAYLIECQIYDWSGTGAKLRLFDAASVPGRIQLFEDASERIINAMVVWRRRREIGIYFIPGVRKINLTTAQLASLRAGYNPAKSEIIT
jgi:hypothetical protein